MRNGLHLNEKGAAVFADGLTAAVDSGMGSITNIFGSTGYTLFKLEAQWGLFRGASSRTRGHKYR